jgi:DNA damage-inducible protein 1
MVVISLTMVLETDEAPFQLEIDPAEHGEILRGMVSVMCEIPVQNVGLFFREKQLRSDKSLRSQGVRSGDLVVVKTAEHAMSRVESSDVQAQRIIEQRIAQENILANMERAIDESPESFAKVLMLYVPISVHKHAMAAFVDSGAQTTIMSVKMAKKCGLMRLVDGRFAGVAAGVGTARIIGRIHSVDVQLGSHQYRCAITVLEDQSGTMDFLLGLDMLRKHHCMIDLKNDCLHVGDDNLVPFLPESKLPAHAKLTTAQDLLRNTSL